MAAKHAVSAAAEEQRGREKERKIRNMSDDAEEERQYFVRTVQSFAEYERHSVLCIERMRSNIHSVLSADDRGLLRLDERFDRMIECVRQNALFFKRVIAPHSPQPIDPDGTTVKSREGDMHKVRAVLRQLARDWSAEGAAEREVCYGPILRALQSLYPDAAQRSTARVCVPGAGLARLALEIRRLGFWTEGNEFSFHMLFTSDHLLVSCRCAVSAVVHCIKW